jgi:acetoin utilization protein AcuB
MLAKNWMSQKPITIQQDDSMHDAMTLLKEHRIRMLPVMRNDTLVGVITDRDLRSASASKATSLEVHELAYLISRLKIKEIMSKNPITIPMDYTVEETAEVLLKNRINGAPVVDNEGKVMGVITQTDILKILISLTGLTASSIHFGFILADQSGSIKLVTDIIRKFGGRISSILGTYENVPEGYRNIFITAFDLVPSIMHDIKVELKANARLLFVIDHREDKREFFDTQ